MLGAYVVVGPDDGAVQEAPYTLHGVGVHLAPHPLLSAVVYGIVDSVVIPDAGIGRVFVGVDGFYPFICVTPDEPVKRTPVRLIDDFHADLTVPLDDTGDNGLIPAVAVAFPTRLTADERLIDLDGATEGSLNPIAHCSADTMAEIPGCFVAHVQGALKLVSADTLLGLAHAIDCKEPLPQREMGIMEDGARQNAEMVIAGVTGELTAVNDARNLEVVASGTGDAFGPAQRFQIIPTPFVTVERVHKFDEIHLTLDFNH